MVATSYPIATNIGLSILKKGGGDAALGLMEPCMWFRGAIFLLIHKELAYLYKLVAEQWQRKDTEKKYNQFLCIIFKRLAEMPSSCDVHD